MSFLPINSTLQMSLHGRTALTEQLALLSALPIISRSPLIKIPGKAATVRGLVWRSSKIFHQNHHTPPDAGKRSG